MQSQRIFIAALLVAFFASCSGVLSLSDSEASLTSSKAKDLRPPPNTQPGHDESCGAEGDPFSLPTRLPTTRVWENPEQKSEKVSYFPCLGSSQIRSVIEVRESEKELMRAHAGGAVLPELEPGSKRYANILHRGDYWYADVPLADANGLWFQLQPFPNFLKNTPLGVVELSHIQVRVQFSSPVTLWSYNSERRKWKSVEKHSLVFSVGAGGAPGEGFSVTRGAFGKYMSVYEVSTAEGRYTKVLAGALIYRRLARKFGFLPPHQAHVREYPLHLPGGLRPEEFVASYFKRSEVNHHRLLGRVPASSLPAEQAIKWVMPASQDEVTRSVKKESYDALHNNCSTALAALVDKMLEKVGSPHWEGRAPQCVRQLAQGARFFPSATIPLLKLEGLIGHDDEGTTHWLTRRNIQALHEPE